MSVVGENTEGFFFLKELWCCIIIIGIIIVVVVGSERFVFLFFRVFILVIGLK